MIRYLRNNKTRTIIWLGYFFLLSIVIFRGLLPFGQVVYRYNFNNPDYFIRKLTPAERVLPANKHEQGIIGEPVYFSVYTPRTFDQAKITLTYKIMGEVPVVEVGVLAHPTLTRYRTVAIENQLIDDLAKKWQVKYGNGYTLLEQENKYQSVDDFFKSLPPTNQVATYRAELPLRQGEYNFTLATSSVRVGLRGSYQFFTYINRGQMRLKLNITDRNQNNKPDPTTITVYRDGKSVFTRILPDDGVVIDTWQATPVRTFDIESPVLEKGIYQVEVAASDDITTNQLMINSGQLGFSGSLWLADTTKPPILAWTDGQEVSLQVTDPAKEQVVLIGQEKLVVDDTFRLFRKQTSATVTPIKLEKNDIRIVTDGVVAFNRSQLFNPRSIQFGINTKLDERKINYVLTEYLPSENISSTREKKATLDLHGAYREGSRYGFMIALPGLKNDASSTANTLVLSDLSIEFNGSTLWQKIARLWQK
ncbi:MAG: hypothetical protein WCK11_00195 [Candidatus Falkowbacteria bacterium]